MGGKTEMVSAVVEALDRDSKGSEDVGELVDLIYFLLLSPVCEFGLT